MGTRNLTMVQKDGEYKIAQYGQWDGYPSGNGIDILNFMDGSHELDRLEGSLANVDWITYEENEKQWVLAGAGETDEWVSMEVADKHLDMFPENSRDTGAGILRIVSNFVPSADRQKLLLRDRRDFAGDSLFCEWAYVIDFDKRTFEVYEGFNTEPLNPEERFYNTNRDMDTPEYFQIRLKKSYSLDNLPSREQFLADCEP